MDAKNRIESLLRRYQVSAKITFGQNFLIDDRAIDRIIDLIFSSRAKMIVEIGCGLGSLTAKLVSRETEVIGFELDNDMVNILRNELKCDNFHLVQQDFLLADLASFDASRTVIVGNLPYYITRRLIEKVVLNEQAFDFYFMVQKEVGDKLMFKPGRKINDELAAYLALHGQLKEELFLPPSAFAPAPKVHSVFMSYHPTSSAPSDYSKLKKIYSANNKTLRSRFKDCPSLVLERFDTILGRPSLRAHELTLAQLEQLLVLPIY